MKISRLFMFGFLAFGLVAFTTSCEGEDGMDGMDGIDGAVGAQGPAGTDGEDGEDGNANVVSVTFDAYSVVPGSNEFDIPAITQEIYDNGVVLGYVTVSGNAFWETIPVVIGTEVRLDFDRIYLGGLRLVSDFAQTLDFRFIIIQGTPASGRSTYSLADVEEDLSQNGVAINNYQAVVDYFDLEN